MGNYSNYDDALVVDDDYHSLRTNDDYSSNVSNSQYSNYLLQDDDTGNYYSTQKTVAWFDKLLRNTTVDQMGEGQLVPIEDINPDNVLATFVFNAIVCVILLGLYEILRRLIPSVYSQRIVHAQRRRCNTDTSKLESHFASLSQSHGSGSAVSAFHNHLQNEELGYSAMDDNNTNNNNNNTDDNNSTGAASHISPIASLEELQQSYNELNSNKNRRCGSLQEWFSFAG